MKNFYEFLDIINEAPETPPASPGSGGNPPAGGSPTPAAGGLGAGGLGGGLGGPAASLPPMAGPPGGGMPDMSLGSPQGDLGGNSPQAPVKPTKIKSLNVWTALEKFINSKNKDSNAK
jgi:hypothetical protein